MRANEFLFEVPNGSTIDVTDLDEDWKKTAAALGAGAALTLGGYGLQKNLQNQPTSPASPTQVSQQQSIQTPQKLPTHREYLTQVAKDAGMSGNELTQFIAQAAHETLNFTRLEEVGTPKYFAKKYDVKYNPRKAKILGNTNIGDGERYKGRGYLQITGRYNYKTAGKALGLPLEEHPELLARPDIAAKAALWYWNTRVKPKVTDFSNVKQVTKSINPALKGLKQRAKQFMRHKNENP